ncbi:hypothetical protein ColLi_00865 [Colletotrichum liriopes]|uniref:Uncharacterized protein n=1 Tax=Colletotrichum liriopes TaxID=708192 RepID=A0AA37LNF2_9PEZI|nr:hypothetical protein ColLi_00865 [Colletotrichum liriopes]
MKERIASAMLEVDKLQREIDSVMERQSIYVSSRPSTAHSVAQAAHGQHHQRRISHDSITNFPRPVKDREGFYQCVHAPQGRRASSDSASTVSTSESEDGAQTVPTTWSPSSTLATRAEEPPLERVATFRKEKDVSGSGKTNFAVAF